MQVSASIILVIANIPFIFGSCPKNWTPYVEDYCLLSTGPVDIHIVAQDAFVLLFVFPSFEAYVGTWSKIATSPFLLFSLYTLFTFCKIGS